MRTRFVDTSGWIALHNRADDDHERAARAFRTLREQPVHLVTSDCVVDETLTHIRMWVGHHEAVRFGETVRGHQRVEWVVVGADLWTAAWSLFKQYDDKRFSFTDCTSFAIMRARTIRQAFTFDDDFVRMGFQRWPAPGDGQGQAVAG